MRYSNSFVEIRVGNTRSSVRGPLPDDVLERLFNPHIRRVDLLGRRRELRTFDAASRTLLTGLLPRFRQELKNRGIRYRLRDLRTEAKSSQDWSLAPEIELRDYQRQCVRLALARDGGIIEAGTGAGKTLIGAAIIAALRVPTLWITTTKVLLEQTCAELERYLGVRPARFGAGEQGVKTLTVGLVQALVHHRGLLPLDRFQLVIFDEGHHSAAPTFAELLLRIDARRNYFLSAVPQRESKDQAVLDAISGGVIHAVSAQKLVARKFLSPVEPRFEHVPIRGEMTELQFPTLYRRFIVENEPRNALVVRKAVELVETGESVLLLVERIRHGRALMALLPEDAEFVHGRLGRRRVDAEVDRFRAGSLRLLVATAGLFAEGVNIVGTSAVVFAGGMRSRTRTLQSVGRGMRLAPGKERLIYQDFWDEDELGLFLRHSRRRWEVLREAGFPVPAALPVQRGAQEEEPEPSWVHKPGSKLFLRVDGTGQVVERAECVRPQIVPDRICRRCTMNPCIGRSQDG